MTNHSEIQQHTERKRRKKQERRFTKSNRKKLLLIFGMLLLFICVLIGRLVYINLSSSEAYARVVLAQMDYDSQSIPFKRGDIVDLMLF